MSSEQTINETKKNSLVSKAQRKFNTIKPYLPAICFFCGFTWDNLTLRRIDNTLDMIIFGVYIILVGIVIVLIGRKVSFKFSQFLPMAVQFFFGGLFSSFVVYYFKSASSLPTLLFMFFLLVLLVGNEFIEKKLHDVTFSATLYAIASFMYLNAILPVLFRVMHAGIFLLAIASAFGLFMAIRALATKAQISAKPIIVVYGMLILAYFFNIIPPVPLAKKEMGIYRSVDKRENSYYCTLESPPWYSFWKESENNFYYAPGDSVFCFSSIFAPTRLSKKIFHCWYHRNEKNRKFTQTDKLGYKLNGGRAKGYRGYTYKKHLQKGQWKVAIKTDDNKTLGVIRFTIIPRDSQKEIKMKQVVY